MAGESPITIRPDLDGVAPYVSPQRPARYRMNTNESPYAPPQRLVDEVAGEIKDVALNRYPNRDASDLHAAISAHVSWPADGLWVANGSNEVLLHLFLAFGGAGRSALTFEPTYSLHSLIPKIAATRVLQMPRDDVFAIDVDDAVATIDREQPDVVIVCSPNNPTGNCEPLEAVRALLEHAPGIVLVDEAYGEFADPGTSVMPLLASEPRLVVMKTFSKAWRLAGVRIGYMMAAPEIVAAMARVRLPYHLSAITQIIGRAALRHSSETLALVSAIARERDRIVRELEATGVMTFPSDANFVLFKVEDPQTIWQALLDRGVLVRSYADAPGLEGCLRVTAGLPEETDAFLGAMKEVLDG
ncbi:MAG TPA: histidinol-phosphate transaminase [Actinomycetota bacterium]|jgi:histidinol-phosphate aminotransferase